jgi:hypothetical protein
MNRKDFRDRRYVFIAGALLILGLMIVQSQHWQAKSATGNNGVYSTSRMPAGQNASNFVWQRVGTGDCSGRDVGSSGGSTPDNNQAREGYTAVCWDGGTYRNGGRVFCTYKNIAPNQCTGGGNPGVMYRAISVPTPPTDGNFVWQRVGTGDCSGRDVGSSGGSTPDNNQAREGYTAVCWDGGTYRNSGRVFCTYKNIAPNQCTGGGNPGVMYRAVSVAGGITPTPSPGGPKCDNIKGHWWGWSGDNSGANFFIAPPNFPVDSPRIWAIGGFEVDPNNPNHADRWGEWECVGANKFKLTNRRGGVFNTLTLRDGRLWQDDGRYACLNNANCQ